MASQISGSTTADPSRITFAVESLTLTKPGQLFVSGRWFGIRGRRFVRPTLMLKLSSDGSQRRALAELKHKPWAAEEGELWIASFPVEVEVELADVAEIELSVAPDIAVKLMQGQGSTRERGEKLPAAPAARARRLLAGRARPAAGAQEIERLKARLASAEQATERERAKRDGADRALEDERSESLRLRAELGKLRGELDLARAAQQELSSTWSELDATRTEAHDSGHRLEAATRALDQERAESERLRRQLSGAEATVQRLMQAEAAAPAGRAATKPDSHLPRADRPLNPALGSRTNWLGRALALVVMLAVIAAIVLVVHTTIS
jgi:hypothetical protein